MRSLAPVACIAALLALAPRVAVAADASEDVTEPLPPGEVPLVWKVWPLFDPFVDRHELVLQGGSFERRLLGELETTSGWDLGLSGSVTTLRRFVFVTVGQGARFRTAGSSYALDALGLSYVGGLRIGPLEAGAGVSLVPLTIEHDREWELGALSPGALARVSIVLGNLRLGAHAFEEYCFRWSAEHCSLRGLGFELSVVQTPVHKRGGHPLLFEY